MSTERCICNVKRMSRLLKILVLQQFLLVSVVSFAPSRSSLPSPSTSKRVGVEKTLITCNSSNDENSSGAPASTLNTAIVGAGPSGLLLAHALLQAGHKVSLYESRSDPRRLDINDVKGRAYALGLGMRGRTAIQSVDHQLWNAVKSKGYECERFDLHLSPSTKIRLRDAKEDVEASVLIYQTELCSALLDELDRRYPNDKIVKFNQKVESIDPEARSITLDDQAGTSAFDVIVGCDGFNSIVRKSINHPSFTQEVDTLPGMFKVCRFSTCPPNLDPTSVALLLPKGGGKVSTFVTPTSGKGEGCILFSGSDLNDTLLSTDVTSEDIVDRFPLLDGLDVVDLANQLKQVQPSVASTVRCNTYHCGRLVLCGDAAHATGGVSGQGANSALVDASVLADCLIQAAATDKHANIEEALLTYSQKQVPEGQALYELSIGPGGDVSALQRLRSLFTTARDAIFQGRFGIGKQPLQTLLSQSLEPFSSIRHDRNALYPKEFPKKDVFQKNLADLYR